MEDAELVFFENTILFSLDELLPEKPFTVTWMESGDLIPYRGISFTDENNATKIFYVSMSGEDGSLSLIEFNRK